MIGLHYRNRRIGEFLKELDLVEGRNTGVPVIVHSMQGNGSPNPVFSSPETRDWLSVVLPIHAAFVGEEPGKTAGMSSVKSSVKSSVIITAEEELLDIGQRLRILTSKSV